LMTEPRYYDYWDQRWVFPREPVSLDGFRLRLSHGLDVANTFLVIALAFRLNGAQQHFWTTLLASWVEGVVNLRGHAGRREVRISPRLYWIDAWDGPFGGQELEHVQAKIRDAYELLGKYAERNEMPDRQVADEVQQWHLEVMQTIGKSPHQTRSCAYALHREMNDG